MSTILKDILDNIAAAVEHLQMKNVSTRFVFDESDEGEPLEPVVKITGGLNHIEPSIYLNVSSQAQLDDGFDISASDESTGTYLIQKQELGYTDSEEQRSEVSKAVSYIASHLENLRYESELTDFCERIGVDVGGYMELRINANLVLFRFAVDGDFLQISHRIDDFNDCGEPNILIELEDSFDDTLVEVDAMHISQTLSGTTPSTVLGDIKEFFDLVTTHQNCLA